MIFLLALLSNNAILIGLIEKIIVSININLTIFFDEIWDVPSLYWYATLHVYYKLLQEKNTAIIIITLK